MVVTISTHNGSTVAREHNIRNPKVVTKEPHINADGRHEVWHDEPVRQAYDRLFGSAVAAYNARQSRPERRITSYYKEVCNDAKKHPVYEMIIGVYGKTEDGTPVGATADGQNILRMFLKGWQSRNPNLELIGAYYHADEQGEPHVHIDYIPVAHGYKRGMDTQTGLVKALGEQGFVKQGKATAQILWERRENDYLASLCEAWGLEVEHPQTAGRQHLETNAFKLQQQAAQAEAERDAVRAEINALTPRLMKKREIDALNAKKTITGGLKGVKWHEWESVRITLAAAKNDLKAVRAENKELKQQLTAATDRLEAAEQQLRQKENEHKHYISIEETKAEDRYQSLLANYRAAVGSYVELSDYCNHHTMSDGKTIMAHFNRQQKQQQNRSNGLSR